MLLVVVKQSGGTPEPQNWRKARKHKVVIPRSHSQVPVMKILIADDEAIPLQLLRFQLEKFGHTVISASNGREAWELLQTHDCQMATTSVFTCWTSAVTVSKPR